MAMSKKLIHQRDSVGVPISTKNKKLNCHVFGYARCTNQEPLLICNLHILIWNPTIITCFFYTKIDSAVPYNSAAHRGILDIQYIVIKAKRHFKSSLNDPKSCSCSSQVTSMSYFIYTKKHIYRCTDASKKKSLGFTALSRKQTRRSDPVNKTELKGKSDQSWFLMTYQSMSATSPIK